MYPLAYVYRVLLIHAIGFWFLPDPSGYRSSFGFLFHLSPSKAFTSIRYPIQLPIVSSDVFTWTRYPIPLPIVPSNVSTLATYPKPPPIVPSNVSTAHRRSSLFSSLFRAQTQAGVFSQYLLVLRASIPHPCRSGTS